MRKQYSISLYFVLLFVFILCFFLWILWLLLKTNTCRNIKNNIKNNNAIQHDNPNPIQRNVKQETNYNDLNDEIKPKLLSNQDEFLVEFKKNKTVLHPFRFLKDENGKFLSIVVLTAFFRTNQDKEAYYDFLKNGIDVIGITAYRSFPVKIDDPSEDQYQLMDDFDYVNNIDTWLYCMRNYSKYGFDEKKHNLLEMSESDFYTAEEDLIKTTEKKYDFIYICLKDTDKCPLDGWQAKVRNYNLALKALPILCNQFGLKGLLVGRVGCGLEAQYPSQIETTDFLPYSELQQKIRESRFLFVPNISDASPRVVAESLIKNIPVLMNINILCGFKYINEETGVFFSDENDIGQSIYKLLTKLHSNTLNPQEWWKKNYSYQKSSIKLRDFLSKKFPEKLKDVKMVSFVV